jgi:hypothetical protein
MLIKHDLRCEKCGEIEQNVYYEKGETPVCPCGGARGPDYATFKINTPEWGGPKFFNGLDRTFNSRSELNSYLKEKGLQQAPSADKHHGARNESHLNLGKIFSYPGQTRRST